MPAVQSIAVVRPLTHESPRDFGAVITGLDLENLSGRFE